MKNIQGWTAAAAVVVVLGACTTEVTTGDDAGGGTTATTGAAGSTTATTGTGTGGGGAGGTGGSSGNDGGTCSVSASPSTCERCSFDLCMPTTCECMGNAGCKASVGEFWSCLSDADGGDIGDCTLTFSISANGDMVGGGFASRLATCMTDCDDRCKGLDGGSPRR
jgi:hypothetical protein